MPSSLWKDTLREIKKTLGRFFSIFAIVAIGVAFFAGVKASVPDMKYTADAYFDEYNLLDFRIVSTVGFTKEDVQAIREVKGVEGVDATYTMEALTMVGPQQLTLKVHALPEADPRADDPDYINQANLQEGRMPRTSGECLIEKNDIGDSGLKIGDTIVLSSGTNTDISESLKTKEYTIVGTTFNPNYLSYEKGSSSIGSGKIDNYIMILKDDFKSEYYTEVNVTVKGAKDYNSYEEAYFEITDKVKTALEDVGADRSEFRFEEIKKLANEKYEEGLAEYEDGKKLYEEEITKAKDALEDAKIKLAVGENTLQIEKKNYEVKMAEGKQQLETAKAQLASGQQIYQNIKKEFDERKPQLEEQLTKLEGQLDTIKEQVQRIDEQIAQTKQQLEQPGLTDLEKELLNQRLTSLQQQKDVAEAALPMIEPTISAIRSQLENTQSQLQMMEEYLRILQQQIDEGERELEEGKKTAELQFALAEQELIDGRASLISGQMELAKQEKKGLEELELAEEKLEKAKRDIEELPQPQWYVLDRHSHYSYMDYGSVADRMDGISKVFPLFFFLVAALVCLTTMTRMVEEQRSMIGTMKALGYGKAAIAFKYVFYAFVASVLGSIVGCAIGMTLFPTVIFNAWALMYTIPHIKFVMQPVLAFTASFIVIGITMAAAYAAVYKELMEVPSQLMRPKAPKVGKKILLERITVLWSRFSFIQKVTARNIFRYKKRFLMTVIGISGCTALLVAGFGIQDSISEVVSRQYGNIMQYDLSVMFDKDASLSQKEEIMDALAKDGRFEALMGVGQYNGNAYDGSETEAITIVVPSDIEAFKQFVSLHTRIGQKEQELSGDSVLISEKLSMNLNVSKGDTMMIDDGDGIQREVKVGGIVENYIGHYVYMAPGYYKDIFHVRQVDTALLAKLNDAAPEVEVTLGNELMKDEQITSVTFYSGIAESFQDTIASLSFVVVVLIIAAGMLAFVVLYNLTNVNISERVREIATIKVLGFYDKEVSAYVYRENIFLTMIGAFCGLFLGIGLHQLIMNLAELESVMFGRNIALLSFVLSFLITMLFSIIVNLVMYRKLKEVPMVESLKSVE